MWYEGSIGIFIPSWAAWPQTEKTTGHIEFRRRIK
jgi:hypothetical protein